MNFNNDRPANLYNLINDHLEYSKQAGLQPLLAVIGPTASGKTALGIALAKCFQGEIISADSRQIYQEMDIGTAKPTASERLAAVHHLIDFVSPQNIYTLSHFLRDAQKTIHNLDNQDKLPILVGGTGLYVSGLTSNYRLPGSKPDPEYRAGLEKIAAEQGKEKVHQMLAVLDPVKASKIPAQNLRYTIRALEIIRAEDTSKSEKIIQNNQETTYHTFYLTIDWPRAELYQKIENRIDQMLADGLIEETSTLIKKYSVNLPAMSSLGYQEIAGYLNGDFSLEHAIQEFKKHSRQFAKRQLTWFRKFQNVYSVPGNELFDFIEYFSAYSARQSD